MKLQTISLLIKLDRVWLNETIHQMLPHLRPLRKISPGNNFFLMDARVPLFDKGASCEWYFIFQSRNEIIHSAKKSRRGISVKTESHGLLIQRFGVSAVVNGLPRNSISWNFCFRATHSSENGVPASTGGKVTAQRSLPWKVVGVDLVQALVVSTNPPAFSLCSMDH